MSGEVSVLSGAPVVDVNPITGEIQVILGGPPGPAGADGGAKTWYNGAGAPSGATGAIGDFYLDTTNHAYYGPKSGGGWGTAHSLLGPAGTNGTNGTAGAAGADGRTWYSGTGAPSGGLGVNGDYYMDTAASAYYGPKTAGAWGTAHSIIGSVGPSGTNGTNGRTWLNGSGAPSSGLGADGDFYVDTTNKNFYGPKTAGAWGTGIAFAGNTWLNGTGAPSSGLGNNGDLYLDKAASIYYGPKAAGVWGTGTSLFGHTWYAGSGTPANTVGVDGDFYMDTTNSAYSGPKVGGVWPTAVSLQGTNWLSGTATPPANSLGKNGDFYFNTTTKSFYGPKAAGAWPGTATSMVGANGANGATWLSGSGAPSSGIGVNGDFYLDVTAKAFYGPKASGTWPSAVSLVGAAGVNGKTWYNGTGAPSSGLGVDGDFYMDTAAKAFYGPKVSGAWGSAISMIGATNTTAAFDSTIDASVAPSIANGLIWNSGANLETVVQNVAQSVMTEAWVRTGHMANTQAHGMPAPSSQLLFKSAAGVVTLTTATTPPAVGTNPPSGSIYLWVQSEGLHARNKDGVESIITPTWDTIFLPLATNAPDILNNTTPATILSSPSLPINSDWHAVILIGYLVDPATGINVTFTGPAGMSFDYSQMGLDPSDTGTDNIALAKLFGGNMSSTVQGYCGQGATRRSIVRTEGYLQVGSTAGALNLQVAQRVASATLPLQIRASTTYIRLERVG
jgi:hypothetical protein